MTWFSQIIVDWETRDSNRFVGKYWLHRALHDILPFFIVHLLWSEMAYKLIRSVLHKNQCCHISTSKIDYVNSSLIRCFDKASSSSFIFQPVATALERQREKKQMVPTNEHMPRKAYISVSLSLPLTGIKNVQKSILQLF